MTVSEQVAKDEWEMIPGTTVVPFNFRLDDPAHITVYQDGVVITSYTCPSYGLNGGHILLDAPTGATHIFSIVRKQPIEQEVDYDPYGPFPAEATEAAMDRMAMMVQEQQVEIGQSLKLKHGVLGQSMDMPTPEAYKFLRWSSGEDQILNSIYGEDDLETAVSDASNSATAAAASAAAAAASEAAALTHSEQAEDWSEEAIDVEVEPGRYSALHWADKASQWAEAAVDAEVETGQYSALHWSDKASQWAESAEDTEVETGQYSALHWSAKSHGWAETDEDVEVAPGEYSAKHYSAKAEAAANNITAQRYTAVSTSGQTVINPGFSMDSVQKNAILYLDGIRQVVDVDFTIGTTTITLLSPIPSGVRIVVESIAATAGATPAYATECGDVDTTYAPDNYALDTGETKTIDQHLGGIDNQIGFMGAFRNLIINPQFTIAQRGNSFTGLSDGSSDYYLDMWRISEGGTLTGVYDLKQTADHPTQQSGMCLEIDITTAQPTLSSTNYLRLEQRIEAQFLQHLLYGSSNAKTLTLSFWVKSAATGTYPIVIYATDDNRGYVTHYTVNTANTWEKKSITFAGNTVGVIDNNNGNGLYVIFGLGHGTNYDASTPDSWVSGYYQGSSSCVNLFSSTAGNWRVTDVQLELGELATPLEQRDIGGVEEMLCKRYFERLDAVGDDNVIGIGQCTSATALNLPVFCSVEKRDTPAIAVSAGFTVSQSNGNRIWATGSSTSLPWSRGFRLSLNVASGLTAGNASRVDLRSGTIDISAEL